MPYNIILYVNIIMPKLLKPSRVPKRNIGKKVKKRKRVFRKKKDPQISQKVSIKIDLGKQMKEAKGYEIPSRGRVTFDPLPPPQAFQVEKREAFEFPKQEFLGVKDEEPRLTLEDVRREVKEEKEKALKELRFIEPQKEEIKKVIIKRKKKEPKVEEIEDEGFVTEPEERISPVTGKPVRKYKKRIVKK